jgi:hypothetical protein
MEVWSASRPGRFTPWERGPCTYGIGGLVDPRAGLDVVKKRKIDAKMVQGKTENISF